MTERSEQPAPIPRPGVPSIQAAVRADLRTRELVGIERYGTPLQPHNGRDALRDAYEEALDLSCYLRQVLIERDDSKREDAAEGTDFQVDGDLLKDIVLEACPAWMADLAAGELAERILAGCVRSGYITVLRGRGDEPWTPEPVVEEHTCCECAR